MHGVNLDKKEATVRSSNPSRLKSSESQKPRKPSSSLGLHHFQSEFTGQ